MTSRPVSRVRRNRSMRNLHKVVPFVRNLAKNSGKTAGKRVLVN
ncbi:MAG: hypothetical protein ACYDDA_13875 [Acidiferrobacteraceae bacterium]